MMRAYFDDSLPTLVAQLELLLPRQIESGVVLRDACGTLSFVADAKLPDEKIEECSNALRSALGPYAREDRPMADHRAPGASALLAASDARVVEVGERKVKLIDRRIIAADWLLEPRAEEASPPRLVFASLKGGVGRSTALAVLAADEARRGRNVLVVDLDLEAPGIGAILLAPDRRPRFGVVDYLVDNRLQEIPDCELGDFVGVSGLTSGAGLVEVVPGVGTAGLQAPQNFMAKLSRAMIEGAGPEETSTPLRDQLARMLDRLVARRPYDLVLIDARAGLSELAPGPILGFGATVLLFGTAQEQTIEGYRYLFSHLQSILSSQERRR